MAEEDQQVVVENQEEQQEQQQEVAAAGGGVAGDDEGDEEIVFDEGSDSGSDDDDEAAAGAGAEGEEAGGASTTTGGAAGGADTLDFDKIPKKEAKNMLDEKTYKKWKKWYKARKSEKEKKKKDKKSDHKKDKKEKKEKEKKKEKKEKSSSKRSKKAAAAAADGEDDGYGGYTEGAAAAALEGEGAGGGMARVAIKVKSSAKVKQNDLFLKRAGEATGIVKSMTKARTDDENARRDRLPPLNRLAIRENVVTVAQRPFMHELLVKAGFLVEICGWLCDPAKGELAPLDLRSSALSLLMGFDFEGVQSVRKKMARAAAEKRKTEDLSVNDYEGISAEDLRMCDIGAAINFIRNAPQETRDNREKATILLERMSRTFNEQDEEEAKVVGGAKWSLMNDRSVACPFETVKTETEAFMGKCVKLDPEDPTSYQKQPPKRFAKSFISGLAGAGPMKRNREDEDSGEE